MSRPVPHLRRLVELGLPSSALRRIFGASLLAFGVAAAADAQCVSLATLGTPVTQDFNTLASSGTSSTTPTGWFLSESGTNANTTYAAGTGSDNAGNTYSFGATASSERAFGGLRSGSLNPTVGACFTNSTGASLLSLAIAYAGEQWRLGTTGRVDRLDFQYSVNATSLTTGTWTNFDLLDLTAPTTGPAVGPLDGNAAANRTVLSSTVGTPTIANGATFWIRWTDLDASGADDGLSVDDFSLTPQSTDAAPAVVSTAPSSGSVGIAVASNLTITFTENVAVTGTWFDITCTSSGNHAATVSGGPLAFTLDPTANFAANEDCAVTVFAAQVNDTDANDPPDNMAANYGFAFDTDTPPLLVINEIDYDQSGTDTAEFVEIRNNDSVAVNLDPVSIQLVNGSGGGAALYQTIDLPAVSLAPGAYFVVCGNATITPNCNYDVTPDTDLVQNGAPDAVGLRWGGLLADAVSYEGATGAPYTETSGTGLVDDAADDFEGISRLPDGSDTGVNNVDLSPRCITPGYANVTADGASGCAAPSPLGLSIGDVAWGEGDAGTRVLRFTVSLDQDAPPPVGVTFDIATADGTAQDDNPATEDNDYVPQALTGQVIPAGSRTYFFDVTYNGDVAVEPGETFFVNVTNVTGISVGDPQAVGTILNDDGLGAITLIHDVQGPGASSPVVGGSVTVQGIVTGVKWNGFFVQEEPADVDANPATSEGIFVFTSVAPPAAAAVGNVVIVAATVSEFVPSADPLQPPLTELVSPTVVPETTGNPLPAPVALTTTLPDPAGAHDQLEPLEGMRVSVASLTVTGPTLGTVNEGDATASSDGVFYGVVTGVARPFREAGIQDPDPAPSGSIPPIPRFDSNPERLRIDSDAQGAPALDVGTGAVVTGLVGPLDYGFRTYMIDPDAGATIGITGGPTGIAASAPLSSELTVASFNLERFFDTVDDAGTTEPVLTATAFDNRLAKGSRAIRNYLRFPDVLGIVECENLAALTALATRINADAVANAQPNPLYAAYLVEGNDIGGIDVGFLVKSAIVSGATPRVEVVSVTQEGAGTTLTNPDTSTSLLNDRPPLVLDAIVHHPNGTSFPIVVIVNHLRSLSGMASTDPGSNGWATDGERIRAKRLEQAKFLANLVQARQTADATEHIVLVGDFNAFEVNDGYVDSMGVINGTPPPDNQTAVPGDGVDLLNPDLDNLFDTAPLTERYSFVFDGNGQSLDHVLANAPLVADTVARRVEHPRIDADFPEVARNDTASGLRLSDHDPIVGYFEVAAFGPAAVAATKTASGTFLHGTVVTYTVVLTNAGTGIQNDNPGDEFTDVLPAPLVLLSASATGGTAVANFGANTATWNGAISPLGSVTITIQAEIPAATPIGTTITNQGTVAFDVDGDGTNESSGVTDDPAVAGAVDATIFVVAGALIEVPTLDGLGLALLAALLAFAAALVLRRWRLA